MTGKMETFLNLEQYKSVVVTYMEKSGIYIKYYYLLVLEI